MLDALRETVVRETGSKSVAEAVLARVEERAEALLYFFFERGARVPFIVAKIAAGPEFNAGLRTEYDSLLGVRNLLGGSVERGVPRVAAAGELFGRFYFLQEFIAGDVIDEALGPDGVGRAGRAQRRGLALAWNWLGDFQRATRDGRRCLSDLGCESLIESYRRSYEPEGEEAARLEGLARTCARLGDAEMEMVASHGDLFPGNVIVGKGVVHVIDWRYLRPSYHPVFDAATFVSTFRVGGGGRDDEGDIERHFAATLFGGHWASGFFSERVADLFGRERRMTRDVFVTLFELSLLEWSTRERAQGILRSAKDAVWRRRFVYFGTHRASFALAGAFPAA